MAKSTYIISIVSFNRIGRHTHEQIGIYEKKKLVDHKDASLILQLCVFHNKQWHK
jgi:hypothetical protein